MTKYDKTKVYKIWSPKGDKIYIGATTKEYLSERMSTHRYEYKNNRLHCKSKILFDEYGIENCFIELIEAKKCSSKDEQQQLEGKYIRELDCVNRNISGRSKKEYNDKYKEYFQMKKKEHYNNNKEEILNSCKEYQYVNKEKISEKRKLKNTCECGSEFRSCDKARHERTQKHLNFLQQQSQ